MFLKDEQVREIEECNIKPTGDGTFCANAMTLALSQNEGHLESLEDEDYRETQHEYQRYQVKKDKIDSFLSKPIWKRRGEASEEVILLEIEALRRSSKKTKITMFKHNNKTGGKLMFGPWFNYALQRIVLISSDNAGDDLEWESYTAGLILLSLLAFVTESNDVVKKGKLADLKSTFGVDWDSNVRTARKVITHCAKDSKLDHECTKCELHVDSLRGSPPSNHGKDKQGHATAALNPPSLKSSQSDDGKKKKQEDEEKKKREDEARKKRMAAMKINQRRASALSVPNEQSRVKTESMPSTVVNPSASSSVTDSRPQTPVLQSHVPDQARPPPNQSIPNGDPREHQFRTQFHTYTPSLYGSKLDVARTEAPNHPNESQNNYSNAYGQTHDLHQSFSSRGTLNQASSNIGIKPQAPLDANDRCSRSHYDSREDTINRYKDRSSDYDSKIDDRYEKSYSRGDSKRPTKRSRGSNGYEKRAMNYSSSAPIGGGAEKWQSLREPNGSRYDNTGSGGGAAFTAPTTSVRGRGRGGVDNRPAWMTHGQSAQGNSSSPSTDTWQASAASVIEATAFSAPAAVEGRGRGRGGVDNRPAWMTMREDAQKNDTLSRLGGASAGGGGGVFNPGAVREMGRGRGRGIDNRPAWMSQQDNN